jgi:hypothetical protein
VTPAAAAVAARLGLASEYHPWLDSLDGAGPPPARLSFASTDQVDRRLGQLGLEHVDRRTVLGALPSVDRDPELCWLIERVAHDLRRQIGEIDAVSSMWPLLPPALGVQGRCFWVFVFLLVVDDIRAWHRAHGVPDTISWETLADLGRHMRLFRRRNACVGLDTHRWMALHFRGALYALGRLQFNPYRLRVGPAGPLFWYGDAGPDVPADGFRRGDRVLGVHIPEAGPLQPSAVDASLQSAAQFFPEHFPEHASNIATCTSWLLDDQLLEYLPADSNIVRFQRRFELVPGAREADDSTFQFVFGRPPGAPDIQPRTALERALVRHLADGGHWRLRTGWLRLPSRV